MGIERQRESPLTHRPWDLRLVLMVARVLVHLLVGIRIFGFRRAPLKAKRRREDIGRHLQKFTLPIFLILSDFVVHSL